MGIEITSFSMLALAHSQERALAVTGMCTRVHKSVHTRTRPLARAPRGRVAKPRVQTARPEQPGEPGLGLPRAA